MTYPKKSLTPVRRERKTLTSFKGGGSSITRSWHCGWLVPRPGMSSKPLLLTNSFLADLEILITVELSRVIFMRVLLFLVRQEFQTSAHLLDGYKWRNSLSPVEGSFSSPIGLFRGHDQENGIPVLVEFRWDKTNPETPTWQQSFSADNGKTWEVNWYMYFSRVAG